MLNQNEKKRYRHLTLLHSNDLHGDFLAETLDEKLVGGVSMLSGYVNKVRQENPNTLYMIAGDMFRGSLIDSEFQGISTIEIMNALAPDVVSLGNHEMDYGIAHLLFLEKCCRFPIVNSNIYIKSNGMRLFNSHTILEVDGMKILVIGIITEEIMACAKKDLLLGTFVDLSDAAQEVGIICDSYKNIDIDFTIVLTHIGYENDLALAKALNPEWGVDVIIGGHSHTFLDKAAEVNNILVVQAGIGTDQIGRFEIEVDTDTNSVHSYTWETVPINAEHCPKNDALENLIQNYKAITDKKYGAILTVLTERVTHPFRYEETTVGNLFADILQDNFNLDLALVGSGSLRKPSMGAVVTAGDLLDMYSYNEKYQLITMTGAQLKAGMAKVLRDAPENGEGHNEYYQVSQGFRFVFDKAKDALIVASRNGAPIEDDALFKVGMEGFHTDNTDKFMGLDSEALQANAPWKLITSNIRVAVEEYMKSHSHLGAKLEGRTQILR